MRRLLCTRRHIPLDRLDDYLSGWQRVRGAAESAGGHAWLFRGAGHEDQYLEFIEWSDDGVSVPDQENVAGARIHLDLAFGAGQVDDWEEAPARESS